MWTDSGDCSVPRLSALALWLVALAFCSGSLAGEAAKPKVQHAATSAASTNLLIEPPGCLSEILPSPVSFSHHHDVFHAPEEVGNARFHRRGGLDAGVDLHEVVDHEVEAHGVHVVLQLL